MDQQGQILQGEATAPTTVTVDRAKLEQTFVGGANWFFWIAALSLINSAILLFGGGWGFVVGLGATQVVDAVVVMAAEEAGASSALAPKLVALTVDAFVAGVFVLFGLFARKRYAWAFIVGMLLYTMDGLLFLVVSDWLSFGFHVFALFGIWGGYAACRKLAEVPAESAVIPEGTPPDPITP